MSPATRVIGLCSPTPQCGKSSVASLLVDSSRRGVVLSFSGPLKKLVNAFLLDSGVSPIRLERFCTVAKEETIPEVGRSYRYLAQTLGTDWGRNLVGADTWLQLARTAIERQIEDGCDLVVLDDMRFPNEAQMIRAMGGELWQVRNAAAERQASPGTLAHPSEGALADEAFDRTIANNGSWNALAESVQQAAGYAQLVVNRLNGEGVQ